MRRCEGMMMLTAVLCMCCSLSLSSSDEFEIVKRKMNEAMREADRVLETNRRMFTSPVRFKEEKKSAENLDFLEDHQYQRDSRVLIGGRYFFSDEDYSEKKIGPEVADSVEELNSKQAHGMRFKRKKQRSLLYKPKMVDSTTKKYKSEALKEASKEDKCGPGTHVTRNPDGSIMCEVCDSGYFSSGSGEDKCSPCPEGTYSSSPRSDVCKDCPGGYMCRGEAVSEPQKCAADTYAPRGSSACSKCALLFEVNEDGDDCRIDVFFYFVLAGLTLLFIACLVMCACSVLFSPGEENFHYYDKSKPGAPFYGTI